MDKINEIIKENSDYLLKHYKSKNIFKRFLWFLLGKRTFYNIIYDAIDIGYANKMKINKRINKY